MLDDGKPVKMIVAPLAGAWIEITGIDVYKNVRSVAPLAGAWIEMLLLRKRLELEKSRSPRGSVD